MYVSLHVCIVAACEESTLHVGVLHLSILNISLSGAWSEVTSIVRCVGILMLMKILCT